jgi:hypothetical protein
MHKLIASPMQAPRSSAVGLLTLAGAAVESTLRSNPPTPNSPVRILIMNSLPRRKLRHLTPITDVVLPGSGKTVMAITVLRFCSVRLPAAARLPGRQSPRPCDRRPPQPPAGRPRRRRQTAKRHMPLRWHRALTACAAGAADETDPSTRRDCVDDVACCRHRSRQGDDDALGRRKSVARQSRRGFPPAREAALVCRRARPYTRHIP